MPADWRAAITNTISTGGATVKDKKNNKALARRIGDFLAGKGFYVVLVICTAVIGISAWVLLSAGNPLELGDQTVSNPTNTPVIATPSGADASAEPTAATPSVEPTPSVKPSPSPSAAPSTEPSTAPNNNASSGEDGGSEQVMSDKLLFVWPLMGSIETMYAVDELVYNETMGDWRTHDGIDIAGKLGTRVMAAADGVVADVYADDFLGTTVVIDHGAGLMSVYANLESVPVVEQGDQVAMGAVIGEIGETAIGEASLPAHLHFAMIKDEHPVDPANYLPQK